MQLLVLIPARTKPTFTEFFNIIENFIWTEVFDKVTSVFIIIVPIVFIQLKQ